MNPATAAIALPPAIEDATEWSAALEIVSARPDADERLCRALHNQRSVAARASVGDASRGRRSRTSRCNAGAWTFGGQAAAAGRVGDGIVVVRSMETATCRLTRCEVWRRGAACVDGSRAVRARPVSLALSLARAGLESAQGASNLKHARWCRRVSAQCRRAGHASFARIRARQATARRDACESRRRRRSR